MCSGVTENATHTAKNALTATAHSRAHHGRASAGASASNASTKGFPPPERGSSKRSQSTAITSAAIPESGTVLSTGRLRNACALERRAEVVPGAHDRDRYPRCVQPKQQRLGPAPCAVEAGRVDVDERDLAARERALDEPVDQLRR